MIETIKRCYQYLVAIKVEMENLSKASNDKTATTAALMNVRLAEYALRVWPKREMFESDLVALEKYQFDNDGINILQLEEMANEIQCTIYDIIHRNAGWAIRWHDDRNKKSKESNDPREGLIIFRYYDTPSEMIFAEIERVKKLLPPEKG
jgi:hypothetical protein